MRVTSVVLLLLSLMASAAGASERSRLASPQLPASAIPYAQQTTLVANAENSVRTVVPAGKGAGVAQIRTLVGHTNFEDQWVFVPSIDLWIEIGKNESVSELDSEVELDTDYLSQIVSLYHDVEIYHFHPAGFYGRVWQQGLFPAEFPADALDIGSLQPVGLALPSPNDVVSSIELSRMLYANDPTANISYAVVSPHGVVTYRPTTAGIQRIAYDWGNPRATIARSIVTRTAIRRMPFNIAATIATLERPTIGQVIAVLCAQATDENYQLSFRSF